MSETEAPIACTLDGTSYRTRIDEIRALTARALKRSHRDGNCLHLVFDPAARAAVEEMVRKEKACCAFLDFQLSDAGGETELIITVPQGAADSADGIFEQFAAVSNGSDCGCAPASVRPLTWAGLGGGGAAAVCVAGCALAVPLAAMGVGVAWLSVLTALEAWWLPVTAFAAAVSATAWFVLNRRGRLLKR
jgi:hypothetical protein